MAPGRSTRAPARKLRFGMESLLHLLEPALSCNPGRQRSCGAALLRGRERCGERATPCQNPMAMTGAPPELSLKAPAR